MNVFHGPQEIICFPGRRIYFVSNSYVSKIDSGIVSNVVLDPGICGAHVSSKVVKVFICHTHHELNIGASEGLEDFWDGSVNPHSWDVVVFIEIYNFVGWW